MLELLLRAHAHNGSADTLQMVTTTLDAMASGGIYDHLGGGFARYSVDNVWLVPHFEKMLYDQALLARVYLHAWQVTGEARYRQVLDETIAYVLRDLRQPDGGFYSAEDADSEGEEGKFYVWPYDEFTAIAPEAAEWYGVTAGGNFEGVNILHRPVRGDLLRPPEIEAARQRLFTGRRCACRPGSTTRCSPSGTPCSSRRWPRRRPPPARGLVHGRRRQRRVPAAGAATRRRAVAAVVARAGGARHLAYAVDHAWLVDAFTRLAEATGRGPVDRRGPRRGRPHARPVLGRRRRRALHHRPRRRAADRPPEGHLFDGATPSANSVAALALLRLSALTGEPRYAERAEAIIRLVHEPMSQHPPAFTAMLAAVDLLVSGVTEIAVVGDADEHGNVNDLVEAVQSRYLPTAVLAWGEPYDSPSGSPRRRPRLRLQELHLPTARRRRSTPCCAGSSPPAESLPPPHAVGIGGGKRRQLALRWLLAADAHGIGARDRRQLRRRPVGPEFLSDPPAASWVAIGRDGARQP